MSELSKKEFRIAAKLLGMASDTFSNHGCNDIPEEFWEEFGMTAHEREKLVREMREWNNPIDEWPQSFAHIGDYALMDFLAAKLEEAGEP